MGIKNIMGRNEQWVLCATDGSLNSTTDTTTLCAHEIEFKLKKKRETEGSSEKSFRQVGHDVLLRGKEPGEAQCGLWTQEHESGELEWTSD